MTKSIRWVLTALLVAFVSSLHAQKIMVTWVGTGTAGTSGNNGVATKAQISGPTDICIDAQRNIYINAGNTVRKIAAATGIITRFAGGGASFADGVAATSASLSVGCICLDPAGNLYIVVSGTRIRRVDAVTNIITTVAGTGTVGYSGDGGPATAAKINSPYGICTDGAGNLYIADNGNNRIRKVDAVTGVITTIAGTGANGYNGDGGPALSAALGNMSVICASPGGDVYFSDQNGTRIRKVAAATGTISHIAGFGSGLFGTGNGGPAAVACIGNVNGICMDGSGDLYIDDDSCACRKIDMTTGIIDVVAGDMLHEGYNGDEADALLKWFNWPKGVCVDADKNLYVADRNNNRIRKAIQLTSAPVFAYGNGQTITSCTAAGIAIAKELTVVDKDPGETETWTVITPPASGTLSGFPATGISAGVAGVVSPASAMYTPPASFVADDSFQVRVSDGIYSETLTVHVLMRNPGIISGPSAVCIGATINLTESVPGGYWAAPGGIATISSAGDVIGVSAGVATIHYSLNDPACGVISATKTISVEDAPDAGIIYGAENICVGAILLWTNSVTGGAWTTDNGNVAYTTGSFFTGVTPGADSIRYTVTTACGTTSVAKAVTVVSLPVAGSITSSADEVCLGGTISLASTAPGGGWTVSNANASVNASGVLIGLAPGTVAVQYTVANACGTDIASKDIIVEDCATTEVTAVQQHPVLVYPNPASATLTVEWGSAAGITSIVITDVTGKAVVTTASDAGSKLTHIDISGLPEGMYMLGVKGSNISEMKKVVVNRK